MSACGFSACEHQLTAELRGAMLREVQSGVIAVMCACGPGVFRREAVSDGYYGEFIVRGHVGEVGVLTRHIINIKSPILIPQEVGMKTY
jgi:hypothetical protein